MFSYLALGDSYTIGEGVALYESFPYQTVQLLRKAGLNFNAPEIVARTGWTTADLIKAIHENLFQESYHVVSLLCGVNDQYQGKSRSDYSANFEQLLHHAITSARNDPSGVFVISIPDWGQTPFALGRNQLQITREITGFNIINRNLAEHYKTQYISLNTKKDIHQDLSLLAADMLHPSKKEYTVWANSLAHEIQKQLA